ncbi:signal peptidase I [bacterium]|nr:signal peptidase I [bacterium]
MNEETQPEPPKDTINADNRSVEEIFSPKPKEEGQPNKPEIPKPQTTTQLSPETPEVPRTPKDKPDNKEKGKFLTLILDIGLNLLIVFGLVFIIQSFIASPFKVSGPSMCDTINNLNGECVRDYGEYIIVNKLIYQDFFGWSLSKPSRGDIIVFRPPHNKDQFYIKRIIGLPGDTIKLIDGKVYLFNSEHETGYELPEPYLNDTNSGHTDPSTNRVTTFNVPEGMYFVMGDNRKQSTDSRSCFRDIFEGGCRGDQQAYYVPRENIQGKASVVLWPLNNIRILKSAKYFQENENKT